MSDTVVIAQEREESTGYRFSWGLAFAGAFAATAVTFFLLTLRVRRRAAARKTPRLMPVHPRLSCSLPAARSTSLWRRPSGFAAGGHLAGRLLGPLVEKQKVQEDFRAAAHGLTVWAIAVVISLLLVALAGMTAIRAGSNVAALYGATGSNTQTSMPNNLSRGQTLSAYGWCCSRCGTRGGGPHSLCGFGSWRDTDKRRSRPACRAGLAQCRYFQGRSRCACRCDADRYSRPRLARPRIPHASGGELCQPLDRLLTSVRTDRRHFRGHLGADGRRS